MTFASYILKYSHILVALLQTIEYLQCVDFFKVLDV